jgi:hypothetical protein
MGQMGSKQRDTAMRRPGVNKDALERLYQLAERGRRISKNQNLFKLESLFCEIKNQLQQKATEVKADD